MERDDLDGDMIVAPGSEIWLEPEPEPEHMPKRGRRRSNLTLAETSVSVSGGAMWANGTFVKNGIVLRFNADGVAETDAATAKAVVAQHREFRVVS